MGARCHGGAFVVALGLFRFVPQQFFPASSRPELLVDLRLPEGSSFAATLEQAKKVEAILDRETGIENYVDVRRQRQPALLLCRSTSS
jgi:multidrug efflux pump